MSRIQTYKRPQTRQNRISNENWSLGNHLAWRNNPRQGAIRCVSLLETSTDLRPSAECRSLTLTIGHSRVLIWHFLPSFFDPSQHEHRRNDSTRYGAETRNCALAKFSEWAQGFVLLAVQIDTLFESLLPRPFSTSNRQFPTIARFVNGVNSGRAEYLVQSRHLFTASIQTARRIFDGT